MSTVNSTFEENPELRMKFLKEEVCQDEYRQLDFWRESLG